MAKLKPKKKEKTPPVVMKFVPLKPNPELFAAGGKKKETDEIDKIKQENQAGASTSTAATAASSTAASTSAASAPAAPVPAPRTSLGQQGRQETTESDTSTSSSSSSEEEQPAAAAASRN